MTLPHPRLLTLAVALALPSAVYAQSQTDNPKELDRVTVSASTSRIPNSEAALPNTITVIDRVQLEQQLALTQDLSQVLANLIPAFSPSRQKLSSAGESVRGRQPLYMIDGVPQSTPLRDGARDAHTIDPAMVERIEVIHGANALQGLGASGGIINIITKHAPRKDGESFQEVGLSASSALPNESDSAGYRGSYLFGTRQGDFDFVGGASYAKEGLYYDGDGRAIAVSGVQGDLMDSASNNLFAKVGWNIDDRRRLQLTTSRYELEGDGDYAPVLGNAATGVLATSVKGKPLLAPPRNLSTNVSLDYSDKALAGGYLQAQVFWADFKGRYGSSRWVNFWGDGNDWDDQSQNVSEKIGGKFTWSRGDIASLPLRLTLGLDMQRDETYQELLASGLNWVPVTTYTSYSPFVQAEYRIGSVLLTGGLRYEHGELEVDDYTTLPTYGSRLVEGGKPTTEETLYNFGAIWEATENLKLYASYSEGYTVADIGRVLRAINRPDQRVENLVDLEPVIADNREIGVDYDDGRWSAHLAAYWSDSDLGSVLVYDAATDSYNVARQKTKIDGIEGNVAFRVNDTTRIGLAYAQADGRYDTDRDGRVDADLQGNNISPDRAIAFWEQRWTDAISTRLQASHALDRKFYVKGVEQTAGEFNGYTTLDLQSSIALPMGRLNLGIENLLGRQYVTYHAQTVGGNDDYIAGRGRVLTVGWSHRF
jgi:iron complex outermembrane receptor protein